MADLVAGRDDVGGQALALGADDERALRRPRQRLALTRDQGDAGAGSADRSSTRASGTSKIAPIDARTAFVPNGSAVFGPTATHAAPNARALRRTVPTLPGSLTPQSATHTGPAGCAQRSS